MSKKTAAVMELEAKLATQAKELEALYKERFSTDKEQTASWQAVCESLTAQIASQKEIISRLLERVKYE